MNIYNLLKKEISQQELLNYYNANISYIALPKNLNGFVFSYKNINNIYINKNLSIYKQRKTLLHELAHIELSQLNQADNDMIAFKRNKYEDEADNYIKFILENLNSEE